MTKRPTPDSRRATMTMTMTNDNDSEHPVNYVLTPSAPPRPQRERAYFYQSAYTLREAPASISFLDYSPQHDLSRLLPPMNLKGLLSIPPSGLSSPLSPSLPPRGSAADEREPSKDVMLLARPGRYLLYPYSLFKVSLTHLLWFSSHCLRTTLRTHDQVSRSFFSDTGNLLIYSVSPSGRSLWASSSRGQFSMRC